MFLMMRLYRYTTFAEGPDDETAVQALVILSFFRT